MGTSYLRKRNVILSAVKAMVRKKTHEYGIEVPTSLVRAKELDRINGNTLWTNALKLEMHNVGVAFEVLEDGKNSAQGSTKASGHIIWDLKMDFTRKARWVDETKRWKLPHKAETPLCTS
jgi:phosphatidate phosphatase APP1